jgi:dTDP-glucose 4,6-dehydratase
LLEQLRSVPVSRKAHPAGDRQALAGEPLPVYGDGKNVRDWLFVTIIAPLSAACWKRGAWARPITSVAMPNARTWSSSRRSASCWTSVDRWPTARPRIAHHLRRRSTGPRSPLRQRCIQAPGRLGWSPTVTFEQGMAQTVDWYLANQRGSSACSTQLSP